MNTAICIVRVFNGPHEKWHHTVRQIVTACAARTDRAAEVEIIDPDEDDVVLAARVVLSSPFRDSETLKDILFERLLKTLKPESDGQIEVELTNDL